ncbi:hypothetical protein TNCV_4967251 [Trichonephila clavipes]|nr:hypothetical protein TNCV_4967251 [Trichonephila clavipes]
MLNLSRLKRPPVGVVWKLEEKSSRKKKGKGMIQSIKTNVVGRAASIKFNEPFLTKYKEIAFVIDSDSRASDERQIEEGRKCFNKPCERSPETIFIVHLRY